MDVHDFHCQLSLCERYATLKDRSYNLKGFLKIVWLKFYSHFSFLFFFVWWSLRVLLVFTFRSHFRQSQKYRFLMFSTSLKKDLNCRKVKAGRSMKYKREKEKNKMNFFLILCFLSWDKLRKFTGNWKQISEYEKLRNIKISNFAFAVQSIFLACHVI